MQVSHFALASLNPLRRIVKFFLVMTSIAALASAVVSCGGSSGGAPTKSDSAPKASIPKTPTSNSPTTPGPTTPGTGTSDTTVPPVDNNSSSGNDAAPINANVAAFEATVYPLLRDHCARCHDNNGAAKPAIAATPSSAAYDAIDPSNDTTVNLAIPAQSRLVVRLATESHYCWTDCAVNAVTMTDAIAAWAKDEGVTPGVPPAPINPSIASAAATLSVAANNTNSTRANTGIIALYKFREGSGTTVKDLSGVTPAMDLTLSGTVDWIPGQGIEIKATGKATASATDSQKLATHIMTAGQYSVEAWIKPSNTTQQGPARIVTYSLDGNNRNFTIGQSQANYSFRNRSTAANITANGQPTLLTTTNPVQTTLQHIVMTFDQTAGRKIYINGADAGLSDPQGPGLLTNWNSNYILALGSENVATDNAPWLGQIDLVAIYEHALTPAEVKQNFEAGLMDTTILTFDLSTVLGIPGSAITLEAADFDKSAYYFGRPTFITPNSAGIPVKGLRIAVNGKTPVADQVFSTIDTTVTSSPQVLSSLGAVIAKDKGPTIDQFTLVFDALGDKQNIVTPPTPTTIPPDVSIAQTVPDVGIRTFEQINNTMAAVTGVDPNGATVSATFNSVKQQLPSAPDIQGFLSSQQTAIARLALDYCDALVESQTLRDRFFGTTPTFEFGQPPATAFNSQAKKDVIIDHLINNMIGTNLSVQPAATDLRPAIQGLIDNMNTGCRTTTAINCTSAARTRAVVKAACASVLSSASMLIQ